MGIGLVTLGTTHLGAHVVLDAHWVHHGNMLSRTVKVKRYIEVVGTRGLHQEARILWYRSEH
jgi:hypothetical protein